MTKVYLTCPFCGDDDFDQVGLKAHFFRWCEKFSDIPTPEEEDAERRAALAGEER